ncbi:hypothetical protein LY78DRAFT_660930 [Colletotrichum sublineola]|nr:hypothetical protein LY78DRAFT_660930 [Colletotrichum sublineola]
MSVSQPGGAGLLGRRESHTLAFVDLLCTVLSVVVVCLIVFGPLSVSPLPRRSRRALPLDDPPYAPGIEPRPDVVVEKKVECPNGDRMGTSGVGQIPGHSSRARYMRYCVMS